MGRTVVAAIQEPCKIADVSTLEKYDAQTAEQGASCESSKSTLPACMYACLRRDG